MRGRFITFEGGEGAGKSTQVRRLASFLETRGIAVVVTREPGGTEMSESIRALLLSDAAKDLGAEGEAVLFSAARADHVDRVIRPALAEGKWVICDRFIDSTEAYQGGEGGVDRAFLERLERVAIGDTRPDLTFIFDLPVEVGLKRVERRYGSAGEAANRFERDSVARHDRRRRTFLAIAAREPQRCVVIDASLSEDEVFAEVRRVVESRFPARAA